jgi:ubiquinone/menaquinone biosynthesis C-methylase UbiE
MQTEKERIEQVYAERERTVPRDWYTYFNIGNLFMIQERERILLRFLDRHEMNPLTGKAILDLGCGAGGELRNMVRYGASAGMLTGIDMLADRIAKARELSPDIRFIEGSGTELPFETNSFDMVTQFTVFTSIVNAEVKAAVAGEMLRVLRPDGIILWYDFRYSNPGNKDVQGIGLREIKRLFPDCTYDHRTVTLLPPLTRRLAPISWIACTLMGTVPVLRSHYLIVIRKRRQH